jgi:hypothetical protein
LTWRRLGLLFAPPTGLSWMSTHAALPVAEPAAQGHRVYFSGRDSRGRARIGWAEVDLTRPGERPLSVSDRPALDLGPLGAFDDHGVTSSWTVSHGGRRYHYYTGWTLGVTVPFYLAIGAAVSDDGGLTYRRLSEGPILGTGPHDPYLTASPCVLVEAGVWRMWYVSGTRWETVEGRPKHYYNIRYAESSDGITWRRTGRVCIDYASADEYAIARPCVVRDGALYRMWYCHRGARYRIGYAESTDGLSWTRRDEQGLDPAAEGWDSEMAAYPFVLDAGGRRYMLYNGAGYGQSGVGLAILEQAGPAPDVAPSARP